MRSNLSLEIRGVSKSYCVNGSTLLALDDVSFTVEPGEFVTILGASGCGKSTLLRLIIGLDADYRGDILLEGERVAGPGADRSIVFQEARLLPWLTIEQNVALGLDASGTPAAMSKRIAAEQLKRVQLAGFERAYPHQLSGGMAQRAAIARALVSQPKVLLLDEPLGALDSQTRAYMQEQLLSLWRREGITIVMVTHDIEEAVYLSDKIVVMEPSPGRVRGILPIEWAHSRDRGSARFARLKERIVRMLMKDAGSEPAFVDPFSEDVARYPALFGG
ncbi:MAG TPA: ABC transporter ATP-binding protein [Stellaceae bacterium]|nr:ABC transporter ATP-binding protein [Stellaceae bacterium]